MGLVFVWGGRVGGMCRRGGGGGGGCEKSEVCICVGRVEVVYTTPTLLPTHTSHIPPNTHKQHILITTPYRLSSDDALVKERKRSTIVKHYHSLLKKNN